MDLLCDAIGIDQPSGYPPDSDTRSHEPAEQLVLEDSSSPGVDQSRRPNRCHLCGRTYERADHLNRHLKSHENARPHRCSQCPKSFNRADLLNRHRASHDRTSNNHPVIVRGERVASACSGCVGAKAKCQDQKPCIRCVRKGIPCEPPSKPNGVNQSANLVSYNDSGKLHRDDNVYSSSSNSVPPYLDFRGYSNLPMVQDIDPSIGFVPQDSFFSQDMDFGIWDIDLDSVEVAYFGTQMSNPEVGYTPRPQDIPRAGHKDVSKRHAAFERSPWLWTPTSTDHKLNDQQALDVDEDSIPPVLTPASPDDNIDEFSQCCIKEKQRDQMLSLMFTLPSKPTQARCLPSLSLLNSIIKVYFNQESFAVNDIIHVGTFNPARVLPHLLIAITSAGSTFISTPAIWKMGLALYDVVRLSLGEFWEKNNSNTRNLQSVQAFMIGLDVGLWSGFKRLMEIAESFAQPAVIMLRRAGAFADPGNLSSLEPTAHDPDQILETKWRNWVERESFKRLVIHLFMHDIHASIALQKPPQITFTELKFHLPASRPLWLARTATEWRSVFLSSHASPPPPTLIEALHQPDILPQFSSRIDVHLTALTLLHGYWGQIYSLLDAKKFFPLSKNTHRLCLNTTYTELHRDLTTFSTLLPSLTHSSPEAMLVSELLLMILHVSPEDLQRFAGKNGEEEARKATEEMNQWVQTREARLAIWHAGQVLKAAKSLMLAQCRGFNAIAVYYSALTLWVYGLLAPPQNPGLQKPHIVLNEGEASPSVLPSFLTSSYAIPVISIVDADGSAKIYVELRETDRILNIARGIYRNNYPVVDELLPPLVENLGNLLRDLGGMAGSRVSRAPSEGG